MTDGSADSLLGECVVFCDNSGLLLKVDEVSVVLTTPHEFPGIKPLCLVLESFTGIGVGCDELFMTTTFGVVMGTAVAVDCIVGGK